MDYSKNPHFTIIPLDEIKLSKYKKNEKFGFKETYYLKKEDFIWFNFNKKEKKFREFVKEKFSI